MIYAGWQEAGRIATREYSDMEVVQPSQAGGSLASTLEQRRVSVHVQCLRSAAMNNPGLIANVIRKWLREDNS